MTGPAGHLAHDALGMKRAIGVGRIARELLVGQVGIVLHRPGRCDDIDAARPVAHGKLRAPRRRFKRRRQIDEGGDPARAVIGPEARRDQVAPLQVGLGAVVESQRCGGVDHGHRMRSKGTALSIITDLIERKNPSALT